MSYFISSSTVLLMSVLTLCTNTSNAQSNNSTVLHNVQPNFYITTPQTGEQTSIAEDGTRRQVSQSASGSGQAYLNTYTAKVPVTKTSQADRPKSRSKQSQADAQYAAYAAAAQVSQQQYAAPSANRSSQQQLTTQNYAGWSSQNGADAGVVATSANNSTPATIQTTYPSYVAHSTEERKGLLSRLLHKNSNAQTQAVQVSNNAYRSSKLSGTSQAGMASWYGSDFHGGKTANGERYNMESMTAAHKTLPFGTLVKVKNERNGQECVVRINNRGPFTKGRILDLSKAAARQLGMIGSGVAKVSMQVIGRS